MVREQIAFGPFRLDFGRRELWRRGKSVPLGGRALDILCILASARGGLVTKDELMAQVWPGATVEESNLYVHISTVRKALTEEEGEQPYLITVPGRGYRFIGTRSLADPRRNGASGGPPPDKPSIAVLPFQNMTGDPEQEYFADGMVEEVTAALSRFSHFLVVARTSSFSYKGRTVDVKQVGQELGARYVLEGSVRKAEDRLRIITQLIDASTGTHLWARQFDGSSEDTFKVQDQVTGSVAAAVALEVERAESERARLKPPESLGAYDYYLRAAASVYEETREGISEAIRLLYRAIELDPSFASAFGLAAWCYNRRKAGGWSVDRPKETAETARLAQRAAGLGKYDAVALAFGGMGLGSLVGDLEDGLAMIERALVLNPNLPAAWSCSGFVRTLLGEPDVAITHHMRAMHLSPLDPLLCSMRGGTALAHFVAARYDEASSWAEQALREQPNDVPATRFLAASRAMAGQVLQAQEAMARLRRHDPQLRLAHVQELIPFRRPEDLARFAEGLRRAGLPE
jgi:TolB-like protein